MPFSSPGSSSPSYSFWSHGLLLLLLLLLSRFSRVRLSATSQWQPTRLPRPWDSPGKNTGVGCHFLLQCMNVKSESEVAQSCPTLCNLMDSSLPSSSVRGILQARVLEWGATAFYTHVMSFQNMLVIPFLHDVGADTVEKQ